MKRLIIQIVLVLISLVLIWFIYDGIRGPIKFNEEKEFRRQVVIKRLKLIRDAQLAFKNVHGRYTGSFDTLLAFVETGKIPLIKLTADPTDTTFTKQIVDTVGYVSVKDSIFKGIDFNFRDVRYIPFSGKVEFEMKAGTTTKGNIKVNVIQVFAANKYFLKDMNLRRYNVDPEDGLKFGSLTEPTTDGNWE